jgi:hypothetical protein
MKNIVENSGPPSYKTTPSAMKKRPYERGGLSWQGQFSSTVEPV